MDVWEATSTTSMDVEKVGLKISLGLKIRGEKRKKGGGKEERKIVAKASDGQRYQCPAQVGSD